MRFCCGNNSKSTATEAPECEASAAGKASAICPRPRRSSQVPLPGEPSPRRPRRAHRTPTAHTLPHRETLRRSSSDRIVFHPPPEATDRERRRQPFPPGSARDVAKMHFKDRARQHRTHDIARQKRCPRAKSHLDRGVGIEFQVGHRIVAPIVDLVSGAYAVELDVRGNRRTWCRYLFVAPSCQSVEGRPVTDG